MRRVNSGQASSYYTADDYYLSEDKGQWYGTLAQTMGFTGAIKEDDFMSLVQGVDPKGRFTVQSKITKDKEEHTAGVDFTFSAPKSVSVAALVLGDERIQASHDQSVKKALDYFEKHYAGVRVHTAGVVEKEQTQNMLVAMFKHVSSRELDPQVHTHCVVMNMSVKENGDVRAMDFGEGFDYKMLLGQIYRSEFAKSLQELGYQVESDSKGLFEIKGIPQELTEEFSKRAQQIEGRFQELLQEHPNKNYSELRQQACIETRKVKDEPSLEVLLEQWKERASELMSLEELKHGLQRNSHQSPPKSELTDINAVIDKAVRVATETEAAPRVEDILQSAMKFSVGQYTVSELQSALDKNSEVVKLAERSYTTFGVIEAEQKIVDSVINGRDKYAGSIAEDKIRYEIKLYELQKTLEAKEDRYLTPGQKEAVLHILNSKDNVIAIQGDAGTGKTTMLDVVRTIAEKEHKEIIGLSFTGKAASEIQEASQIRSNTIDSMLANKETALAGKIVVIDEASLVSIQKLNKVLDRCDENSKVVLIGDTKQLQSIGQGKIFQSLQERDIVDTVRMPEVIRQRGTPEYKSIVDKLGERNVTDAFKELDKQDKIRTIENRDIRFMGIRDEYLKDPKNTILVTASNKDREDLNNIIRSQLIAKGVVHDKSDSFVTREGKNLTGADRFYIDKYNKHDVVILNQDNHAGRAGSELRVIDIDKKHHAVKLLDAKTGEISNLSIRKYGDQVQAYSETERQFAQGDKIIFLKNDKGLDVKNGQTAYITGIDDKTKHLSVKMENGRELTFNPNTQYKYIGHAYAITDYKSQGQTAKNVIYHADTDRKVNFNQAYVGITRGKDSVVIYTNDKAKLISQAQEAQMKTSTLDYNLARAKSTTQQDKLNEIAAKVAISRNPENQISNIRKHSITERLQDVKDNIKSSSDYQLRENRVSLQNDTPEQPRSKGRER